MAAKKDKTLRAEAYCDSTFNISIKQSNVLSIDSKIELKTKVSHQNFGSGN